MTDLLIFLAGTFVTLMVCAAVGLLMWGASEESRTDEGGGAAREMRASPTASASAPLLDPTPKNSL